MQPYKYQPAGHDGNDERATFVLLANGKGWALSSCQRAF